MSDCQRDSMREHITARITRLRERGEQIRRRDAELRSGHRITQLDADRASQHARTANLEAAAAHERTAESHDQAAERDSSNASAHNASAAEHREAGDRDLEAGSRKPGGLVS
jgi:hypothetical protein